MKRSFAVLTSIPALALALSLGAPRVMAADEVTVSGEAKCAKCALHEGKKCQTVIQSADGKVYYLADNAVAKDFHKQVCTEPKQATATGTVKESHGKQVLTASKIEATK